MLIWFVNAAAPVLQAAFKTIVGTCGGGGRAGELVGAEEVGDGDANRGSGSFGLIGGDTIELGDDSLFELTLRLQGIGDRAPFREEVRRSDVGGGVTFRPKKPLTGDEAARWRCGPSGAGRARSRR